MLITEGRAFLQHLPWHLPLWCLSNLRMWLWWGRAEERRMTFIFWFLSIYSTSCLFWGISTEIFLSVWGVPHLVWVLSHPKQLEKETSFWLFSFLLLFPMCDDGIVEINWGFMIFLIIISYCLNLDFFELVSIHVLTQNKKTIPTHKAEISPM